MRGSVWGLLTAAIGTTIIVLLIIDGTAYGIWIDEIGPSLDIAEQAAAPTIVLPGLIGLLAIALIVGGLAVGLTIPRGQRDDRAR
ncbi:hypothetical protein RWH45_03190 [Microbacterium sp. KSW4-17]|uniref:Uncharacterized protein n=1 Tax=Microbacterium galbum TaxID=3075994 RepID=A0ABU3T4A4_9MICO|nr:hypothetical protein [Microbacterium sp. KSW4-17]MDU0366205.1 hypothetical protein [Microbacterium sp. KSW4-17]